MLVRGHRGSHGGAGGRVSAVGRRDGDVCASGRGASATLLFLGYIVGEFAEGLATGNTIVRTKTLPVSDGR